MHKKYLLGIDNGTTTTKATLFDFNGQEIAVSSSKEVQTLHPQPGWAEQSMPEIWEAMAAAIRDVINRSKIDSKEIAGISLSGHGGGVWLLDKNGIPVRNAIIWLDGRAKPYLDRWSEKGLLQSIYDKSGWNLFAGIGPVTIFPWLVDNEPESLEKAAVNITSKDWTKYCLTGKLSVDYSMASVSLLDYATMDFSQEVLDMVGITQYRHLLPELVPAWQIAGYVTREAAEKTGLAEGTPVAGGAFDGACSALGAGCYRVGEAGSTVATAGVHVVLSANPVPDPERIYSLMAYNVPDVYYKTSMAQLAAGNLDWFDREFLEAERIQAAQRGCSIYEIISEEIEEIPVGSGGVIYLPLLQGERSPFVKPEARGTFFGLGDWHKRAHLLRAVFEGVALSTRHNYESMLKNEKLEVTYLSGGASKNDTWCQILADCTGNTMRVPSGSDSGSRGAAINAGVAVGVFKDHAEGVRKMVHIRKEFTPDAQRKAKYDQIYEVYKELIKAAWPIWEKISTYGIEKWEK